MREIHWGFVTFLLLLVSIAFMVNNQLAVGFISFGLAMIAARGCQKRA